MDNGAARRNGTDRTLRDQSCRLESTERTLSDQSRRLQELLKFVPPNRRGTANPPPEKKSTLILSCAKQAPGDESLALGAPAVGHGVTAPYSEEVLGTDLGGKGMVPFSPVTPRPGWESSSLEQQRRVAKDGTHAPSRQRKLLELQAADAPWTLLPPTRRVCVRPGQVALFAPLARKLTWNEMAACLELLSSALLHGDSGRALRLQREIRVSSSPLGNGVQRLGHVLLRTLQLRSTAGSLPAATLAHRLSAAMPDRLGDTVQSLQAYQKVSIMPMFPFTATFRRILDAMDDFARVHIIVLGCSRLHLGKWCHVLHGFAARGSGPPANLKLTFISVDEEEASGALWSGTTQLMRELQDEMESEALRWGFRGFEFVAVDLAADGLAALERVQGRPQPSAQRGVPPRTASLATSPSGCTPEHQLPAQMDAPQAGMSESDPRGLGDLASAGWPQPSLLKGQMLPSDIRTPAGPVFLEHDPPGLSFMEDPRLCIHALPVEGIPEEEHKDADAVWRVLDMAEAGQNAAQSELEFGEPDLVWRPMIQGDSPCIEEVAVDPLELWEDEGYTGGSSTFAGDGPEAPTSDWGLCVCSVMSLDSVAVTAEESAPLKASIFRWVRELQPDLLVFANKEGERIELDPQIRFLSCLKEAMPLFQYHDQMLQPSRDLATEGASHEGRLHQSGRIRNSGRSPLNTNQTAPGIHSLEQQPCVMPPADKELEKHIRIFERSFLGDRCNRLVVPTKFQLFHKFGMNSWRTLLQGLGFEESPWSAATQEFLGQSLLGHPSDVKLNFDRGLATLSLMGVTQAFILAQSSK